LESPPLFVPVTFVAPVSSTSEPYGWTISASNTDPYVNTAEPNLTIDTFYLWLACCDVPDYPDGTERAQGFTAAEFALVTCPPEIDPGFELV
jgi:hypothetical protein